MTDRPIPFSGPMVRAILAGTKTQTRRIFVPPLPYDMDDDISVPLAIGEISPRIKIGDRLWVREAWRTQAAFDRKSPAAIVADFEEEWGSPSILTFYEADKRCDNHSVEQWQESPIGRLRAGMHMPRSASRITLLVTDVRVERLQDISDNDAFEEGVINFPPGTEHWAVQMGPNDFGIVQESPRKAYAALWDRINGPGAWDKNPWVAAYTFKATFANIDTLAGESAA